MFIKFVDIDWFLCNSYPCVLFESLWHVINQESHKFIRDIWDEFISFIFWNFETFWFQNFKKVNSVNLSQIFLLNMWLLAQI